MREKDESNSEDNETRIPEIASYFLKNPPKWIDIIRKNLQVKSSPIRSAKNNFHRSTCPQFWDQSIRKVWKGNLDFRGQRDIPAVEFNGGGKSCSLTRWSSLPKDKSKSIHLFFSKFRSPWSARWLEDNRDRFSGLIPPSPFSIAILILRALCCRAA